MEEIDNFNKKVLECLTSNTQLRLGQCIFNVAWDLYPEVVDMLRGTNKDCFYNDSKAIPFCVELFGDIFYQSEMYLTLKKM